MILDFKLKDYHCEYYAGPELITGVCFSSGFASGKIDGQIYISYMWPKEIQDELNYCYLNRDELISYFLEISKLLGFKLISLSEFNNHYFLQISCVEDDRYALYISTYIRYVYENPFALFLYAALKNRNKFVGLDITQIIHYYLAIFFCDSRCHCLGSSEYAFTNMHPKSQFNLIREDFNEIDTLANVECPYFDLYESIERFNIKILPQIVDGINAIVNKYYEEHKESICRW